MTEERNCKTCGYYNADRCVRPGGCCFHHSNWQPIAQEKPLEKIQMTEEQADQIYDSFLYRASDVFGRTLFKNELKAHGYIRKSVVEEAEEMYSKHVEYKGNLSDDDKNKTIDKMYLAIQELKSEIARLKK